MALDQARMQMTCGALGMRMWQCVYSCEVHVRAMSAGYGLVDGA
jgi:hypothetical protein